jgi:predicted nuclease of predicted toxin-antitoxin system
MRLLFDHNLSHQLVRRLEDLFPNSTQTRLLGMARATDLVIWEHARSNGFNIVTFDKDFSDLSLLHGSPPKVIWMRCGNTTVARIEQLLRINYDRIISFGFSSEIHVLEIWS